MQNTLQLLTRYPLFATTAKCLCSTTSQELFHKIVYESHGEATLVAQIEEDTLKAELTKNEVSLKLIAAPINPADINMIEGTYPVKPKPPAVAGNEGVFRVVGVDPSVTDLQQGDWVIPAHAGFGTWRTRAVCGVKDLLKVSNDLSEIQAATLSVNPCTAYRMLKDFAQLESGDMVIQNAGNSSVGQSVVQIAHQMGLRTVSVVRKRPNFEEIKSKLTADGADYVVTDEYLSSRAMRKMVEDCKPKLALNAVGGKTATEMCRLLDRGGVMVSYGGMSRLPVTCPVGLFIFNDIKLQGFWVSKWNSLERNHEERLNMLSYLTDLALHGKLREPSHRLIPFHNAHQGIADCMKPYADQKQILICDD